MLHYQNVSEATGDQTSEIPLTENHHDIGQNFMLPVLGLHGKKMSSFTFNLLDNVQIQEFFFKASLRKDVEFYIAKIFATGSVRPENKIRVI